MSASHENLIPLADPRSLGLGIGRRTLARRIEDKSSGFPTPVRINNRLYVRQSELDAYKSRLIREGVVAPKPKHAPAIDLGVPAE